MSTSPFREAITSEDELRERAGRPSELAVKKQIATLDAHCRDFIARSPFVLVATSDAEERCDVSPKGAAPGFVLVLDDRRAKAFKRAGLWDPASWPARGRLPSPAAMLLDHARPPGVTVEELERQLQESYTKRLY